MASGKPQAAPDPEEPGQAARPISGSTWRLSGLGIELAGAVGGGCLLGYWIDRQFGTAPWALLIGAAIGIVGGLYNLIRKAVHESLGIRPPPQDSGKAADQRPGKGSS